MQRHTRAAPAGIYTFSRSSQPPVQVCSVLGATLNVLRLPERWLHAPDRPRQAGLLDYWGNSHQLMHVLVAAALLNLHLGGRVDWQYFAANPVCPADLMAP